MTHIAFMRSVRDACLADVPCGSVADWCVSSLRFDESSNHGPYETLGHEYVIEVLDDFGNAGVSDEVLVWGSQTRKTGTLMGGVAWCLANDPCGILWVMPSITLARKFSRQRWSKLLRASAPTRDMIPTKAARHNFSTFDQMLGASTVNFVGSNSAANLSSNPCRRVVLDEVDKFDAGGREEADAVNLAEQRTKDQPSPQRWKTSTPTLADGLIWQEFLKGDQRRYFVPCPKCKKDVLFAWSKNYCTLTLQGCEAFVFWDPKAKRKDGTWDLARVERSAHAVCPHCKAKIQDGQKTAMVRDGKWKPTTKAAAAGFVSRHLPSLYSPSPETSFGKLAVKFLQAKSSLLGLRGFINGDLAEPYTSQDTMADRVELVRARIENDDGWRSLLTVDCQQRGFWFVVRRWKDGNSDGVDAGFVETYDDVREIQLRHKIGDAGVMLDSGYGARSDAEVYRNCVRWGEIIERDDALPLHVGWMPAKGAPGFKRWKNIDTGLTVPYYLRPLDPFTGTANAGQLELSLFEFSGDFFKDLLDLLRKGHGPSTWAVSQTMATEEYWRHMDGEIKTAVFNRLTGRTTHRWLPRAKQWPNHLLDCETMQLALAASLGLFTYESQPSPTKPTS